MKKIRILIFISIIHIHLFSQHEKIEQQEGILQDQRERYFAFGEIKKFAPEHKISIRRLTKLLINKDRVFVLDRTQSQIFVFDMQSGYLYSIGRPGQGPGDLEYPEDFFISDNDQVYILNSMAKRIEIFSLSGEFKKRVDLIIPKAIPFAYPQGLIVSQYGSFLVTYKLGPHLLDMYDSAGAFKRTLLSRKERILVPGANIGNCSQVLSLGTSDEVLYFDHFSGLFTKLDLQGSLKSTFSVFNRAHKDAMSILKKEIAKKNQEKSPTTAIETSYLYSNACVDEDGHIYTFFLLKKTDEVQKLYVFSSEGDFLYWTSLPFFKDKRIVDIYCFGKIFFFVTGDDEIFYSRKEG
jgi:hypothetical protein